MEDDPGAKRHFAIIAFIKSLSPSQLDKWHAGEYHLEVWETEEGEIMCSLEKTPQILFE